MPLKLATWNINSVRLRIDLVTHFLQQHQPDVLCLQETKVRDSEFPHGDFRKAGYPHIAINGQKGYHGVAVVSKHPLELVEKREFFGKGDARHLHVRVEGMDVHNFYVPAGGDEPDPETNEKFAHKLGFLAEMQDWFAQGEVTKGKAFLVGDLNIAPLEHDVWSHKALLKIVSHTPVEVAALNAVLGAGQWVDAMRLLIPVDEKLYTWWSYRAADWAVANKGRRLDHIWLSPSLVPQLKTISVLREARGWERPSDHVPVIVELS